MQEATIAAIATAPGAGGIAVVRLSGAESYQVAARVFFLPFTWPAWAMAPP